jgi:hypothetical protein
MAKKSRKLRIIRKVIALLKKWERKHNPVKLSENPNHFVDLTPTSDLLKSKSYLEALKWALENKQVYNIAIAGPYGSGKSSILKAFEKTNPQFNYLNISLATFQEDIDSIEGDTEVAKLENLEESIASGEKTPASAIRKKVKAKIGMSNKQRQDQHRLVELSILQQIFYRETDETLPQSRFKRIKKLGIKKMWRNPFLLIIWASSFYYVSNKNFRDQFYQWNSMSFTLEVSIYIISAIVLVIGAFLMLVELSKLLYSAKFSKLNLSGAGLEMNYDVEKSILNDHLDEILYFFEATDYDVVIIEDLDRFNDPDIFTKLRELNYLIKNSKQVNRPVKFVYAIKDEMFTDGNRTKFFDFIIPVLPVINNSNALDLFLPMIDSAGLVKPISKKFMYDITLYINDMRVLNNIFNEFMLFKQNLHPESTDTEKLLGMIIYKNIYPKDFSELHHQKGIVYKVMNSKSEFVTYLNYAYDEEISEINKKLDYMKSDMLGSLEELRSIYIQKIILETSEQLSAFEISGRVAIKDASSESNFEELRRLGELQYYYIAGSGRLTIESISARSIDFKSVEREVHPLSYDERAALLLSNSEAERKKLTQRINTLNLMRNLLATRSFKDLLSKNKSSIGYFDEDFRNKELLVYLIRGGYLDEMYESYMSYFYEKSLTGVDMQFLKHVRNLEAQDFGYKIINIEELLHRLEPDDFMMEELLNFNLTDYLIKHSKRYKSELQVLAEQLSNEGERAKEFLFAYLSRKQNLEVFILLLVKHYPNFWVHICTSNKYTEEIRDQILKIIIIKTDLETIRRLNQNENLKWSIATCCHLFTLIPEAEHQEKLTKLIFELPVYPRALNRAQMKSKLFLKIYEQSHYVLNANMIEMMIVFKHSGRPTINSTQLKTSNYTTVLNSKAVKLIKYIEDNIQLYIENVFLPLTDNTKESLETVVILLRNPLVSEYHERIIEKEDFVLPDLEVLDNTLWDLLLKHLKVGINWRNIHLYVTVFGMNQTLTRYLNQISVFKELAKYKLNKNNNMNEEQAKKLALDLLDNKGLSNESFNALLKSISFKYGEQNPYDSVSKDRLSQMINRRLIALDEFNFTTLEKKHPDLHIDLLERNIAQYLKDHNSYALDSVEHLRLLSGPIEEHYKRQLSELIPVEDLLENIELVRAAANRMVQNGLQERSFERLLAIFSKGEMTETIELYALHVGTLTPEKNREIIGLLGGKFAEILNRKKNPDFTELDIHRNILQALRIQKVLVDFRKKNGKLRVYHTDKKTEPVTSDEG